MEVKAGGLGSSLVAKQNQGQPGTQGEFISRKKVGWGEEEGGRVRERGELPTSMSAVHQWHDLVGWLVGGWHWSAHRGPDTLSSTPGLP